jgi:hypothetical protein
LITSSCPIDRPTVYLESAALGYVWSALDLDLVAFQVRQTKMPMINAHSASALALNFFICSGVSYKDRGKENYLRRKGLCLILAALVASHRSDQTPKT